MKKVVKYCYYFIFIYRKTISIYNKNISIKRKERNQIINSLFNYYNYYFILLLIKQISCLFIPYIKNCINYQLNSINSESLIIFNIFKLINLIIILN